YTKADESSKHFPVTGGPDETFNGGSTDAFVAKVKADGTDLVYCGYVGGHSDEESTGIAVDVNGNAYISGWTYSDESTFPAKKGPSTNYNGSAKDAFVARISEQTPAAFLPAVDLLMLDK
ncbi:MAG: SBBP repeat-containing protein, partial [Desulfobacterales bacterium]